MATTATKPRNRTRSANDTKLTFLVTLLRRFPHWAIWLPQDGQWTAVRMRYGARPHPGTSLVWAQAPSARKLCDEIRKAERKLRVEAKAAAHRIAEATEP